jgi:hypothetical protein
MNSTCSPTSIPSSAGVDGLAPERDPAGRGFDAQHPAVDGVDSTARTDVQGSETEVKYLAKASRPAHVVSMFRHVAKGKPAARRGRKARGLSETAQPPTSTNQLLEV